jgi:hypothetical protein
MKLIHVRLIQIKREAANAGFYSVIAGLFFIGAIYFCNEIYKLEKEGMYLSIFLFFICLSIQFTRRDKIFVKNHIENPNLEILSEYILLIIPFSITSIWSQNWFYFPLLIICLLPLPFIRNKSGQSTHLKNLSNVIPSSYFEWLSGLRKNFYFFLFLYVAALALSWFYILPLIILWLITISILPFYTEGESLRILREYNLNSNDFLKKKITDHVRLLLIIFSPVLILNLLFVLENWYLIIAFVITSISLLVFAISLKYSFYVPDQKQNSQSVLLSLVSISSLIPYLLPLPVIMAIRYYIKAKSNLRIYLDD